MRHPLLAFHNCGSYWNIKSPRSNTTKRCSWFISNMFLVKIHLRIYLARTNKFTPISKLNNLFLLRWVYELLCTFFPQNILNLKQEFFKTLSGMWLIVVTCGIILRIPNKMKMFCCWNNYLDDFFSYNIKLDTKGERLIK